MAISFLSSVAWVLRSREIACRPLDRGGAACRGRARCASVPRMRAPNYYAHPGFERAGLRRRDTGWIRQRVLDPASVFIPVWRTQNLVIVSW